MKTRFILLIAILMAACTPVFPSVSTPIQESFHPTPTIQGDDSTMVSIPSILSISGLESLIEKAKGDLAQRLSISTTQIELVNVVDVVWPDTSLGCPQPGIAYAQVLTEGFLIRLEANSDIHEYHADARGQIVSCEDPGFPIIPVTPDDIQDGIPWVPVN